MAAVLLSSDQSGRQEQPRHDFGAGRAAQGASRASPRAHLGVGSGAVGCQGRRGALAASRSRTSVPTRPPEMGLGLVASRACCAATLLTCRSGGYQQGGPGRAQEHYHKPQAAGGRAGLGWTRRRRNPFFATTERWEAPGAPLASPSDTIECPSTPSAAGGSLPCSAAAARAAITRLPTCCRRFPARQGSCNPGRKGG